MRCEQLGNAPQLPRIGHRTPPSVPPDPVQSKVGGRWWRIDNENVKIILTIRVQSDPSPRSRRGVRRGIFNDPQSVDPHVYLVRYGSMGSEPLGILMMPESRSAGRCSLRQA